MKVVFARLNKKGIKGKILSPEDFVVIENLPYKFFRKFERAKRIKGKYNLYLLKKRNMTTKEAINIISKRFGVRVGYAGLKDKFAVTSQYITTKKDIGNYEYSKGGWFALKKIGKCNNMLSLGDHESNTFIITLHDIKGKFKPIRLMPNYFGFQRFGKNMKNHIIGKCIIKRNFSKALKLIGKYKCIKSVPKEKIKFFIHAYQSWLFNKMLEELVKSGNTSKRYLPILGYDTKPTKELRKFMEKEGISQKDFMIKELSIKCRGGKRKSFIKIEKISYNIEGKTITIRFTLPKGSYATILLNEICDEYEYN